MADTNAIGVFVSAFAVASFAGLAALLRSGSKLTWMSVGTQFLNSGMLGLGIALLWYTKFADNIYFLVGVCLLSGLGGMTTIDFVLSALRKGGLQLKVGDGTVGLGEAEEEKKS